MPGGEPATPRKLQQARAQGDLALAPGLTAAASLAAILTLAPLAVAETTRRFSELISRLSATSPNAAQASLAVDLARNVSEVLLPLLVAGSLAAVIVGATQTGGLFSLRLLAPKAARFSPKPWIDAQGVLHSMALALLGAGAVVAAAGVLLTTHSVALAHTIWQIDRTLEVIAKLAWWLLWAVAAIGLALGAAEWALARGRWLGRQRMTRQELMRERRDQYGSDELRERRSRVHNESLALANLDRVDDATLILYDRQGAAALSYDASQPNRAPRILFAARGELGRLALARARVAGTPRRDMAQIPSSWYSAAPGSEIERVQYAAVAERIRSLVEASELPSPPLR